MTATAGPRLAPLPVERWDDDARAALQAGFGKEATDRFLSSGPDAPRVPNVLTTLMHHPGLAGPFLAFNRVLLFTPAASSPGCASSWCCGWRGGRARPTSGCSTCAWRKACGITPDEVEAIAAGADNDATWTPLEADLLAATNELIDGYRIDDATWARLAEHLDERQLVEVVFVVGTYTCLAMAFNSFGLELDPELRTLAAPPLPDSED